LDRRGSRRRRFPSESGFAKFINLHGDFIDGFGGGGSSD